jgi:hypothetical protein
MPTRERLKAYQVLAAIDLASASPLEHEPGKSLVPGSVELSRLINLRVPRVLLSSAPQNIARRLAVLRVRALGENWGNR